MKCVWRGHRKGEAQWVATFSDGCQFGYCTRHRDKLMGYIIGYGGSINCATSGHDEVTVVKWEIAS